MAASNMGDEVATDSQGKDGVKVNIKKANQPTQPAQSSK